MNIDSIKNYPTGILIKNKPAYGLENKQKNRSAELCDNKKLNRGYYSGSFTGLNGAAAGASRGMLNKILDLCDSHTVIAQNLVALVLAAGLRPIAIMSLPGKKDKEDKIYASGHSIASGLIGFGFSSIVMYPLGKAVKKTISSFKDAASAISLLKSKATEELTEKELKNLNKLKDKYKLSNIKDIENVKVFKRLKEIYNIENLAELEHSKAFKNVTKMLDMAPDVFVFGIAKAMLTVALIPPILKYGFGLEKKKKPAALEDVPQQTAPIPPTMEKPEITKFAGGLK